MISYFNKRIYISEVLKYDQCSILNSAPSTIHTLTAVRHILEKIEDQYKIRARMSWKRQNSRSNFENYFLKIRARILAFSQNSRANFKLRLIFSKILPIDQRKVTVIGALCYICQIDTCWHFDAEIEV